MVTSYSTSPRSLEARALVEGLQRRLVTRLEDAASAVDQPVTFGLAQWLRDGGDHGGGSRYETQTDGVYNRSSVNVSVVHYDDRPEKRLGTATAFSAIVHPRHPKAPSMHTHVSYTAMKDGSGFWRVMTDLNPSIVDAKACERYALALREAAPDHWDAASAQGDKYFWIPMLERHRGVCHFYLEGLDTGDWEADRNLAERMGRVAIDTYGSILDAAWDDAGKITTDDRAIQLAYYTLYFFQVLTLDRGTTAGLLVHNDNDVGILGSLPPHVDRELLARWEKTSSAPQNLLVSALVAALPKASPAPVTEDVKRNLADVVREHYAAHPEALALQASGDVAPPTVANHQ